MVDPYRREAWRAEARARSAESRDEVADRRPGVFEHSWQTWNWVNGSVGNLGHLGHCSRPGHRVIILTRCETRVFPVFEEMTKMQNLHLKFWNDESHCQVFVVGLKSLDVSPCNKLLLLSTIIKKILAWEYFFTHKSTFGVHYRTWSPGQLGLRVAGFPGHWVAGSQNVTQFHLWFMALCLAFCGI